MCEADLEREASLCLEDGLIRDSIVVCADVIEHLMNPNPLLGMIHGMLIQGSKAVVLSTPERDLTYGIGHFGPSPNLCHVREWNVEEFRRVLEGTGFKVAHLGLTPSNDAGFGAKTILAVVALS